MLPEPHGEDAGDARIEARPQQRHQACVLEPVVIGPLPVIFELGFVLGLVVGGVEIIHARFEAGIHDRQIPDRAARRLTTSPAPVLRIRFTIAGTSSASDFIGRHIAPGAFFHAGGDGVAFPIWCGLARWISGKISGLNAIL